MTTRNTGGLEREPGAPGSEPQPQPLRFTRAFHEFDSAIPETREVLGGKGLSLVEATRLHLPVPPGIVITTGAWCEFKSAGDGLSENIWREIETQVDRLEEKSDRELGNPEKPLFVSVRSGAPVSMPGAMHTILNIGLNEETVASLAQEIGEHGAWEAYFNFVVDTGVHVYGADPQKLENIRSKYTSGWGVNEVNELPIATIQTMVRQALEEVKTTGHEIPTEPHQQIKEAVRAVFASWESPTAQAYRRRFRISENLGTAAIIQQMVWGNSLKEGAGSGVFFTRDPKTLGEAVAVFAPHAQGPRVVGPMARQEQALLKNMPLPREVRKQLQDIAHTLDTYYERPQEVEFTFDGDRVWMLQNRDVPLSNVAWFRHLWESVGQERLTLPEAQRRINTVQLLALLAAGLDPQEVENAKKNGRLITTGITISLGTASGRAVKSFTEAATFSDLPTILTKNVSLEDLIQLHPNVHGILANNGSAGSHNARIAETIGSGRAGKNVLPVIFAANIDDISPGEEITVNANSSPGEIYRGFIPLAKDGENTSLTQMERAVAEEWLDLRRSNPWRFSTQEEGVEAFTLLAQEALHASRQEFASPKAHAAMVINQLIPAEIRMNYKIIKPSAFANMGDLLIAEVLKSGDHATVRSCYTPDRRGRTPWFLFTQLGDVQKFFDDSLTGFRRWLEDPELTELLVGRIPKDKLNPDPTIQQQHCAWTLACTEMGEIILQVHPFSAELRGHEPITDDDLISYTSHYSSKDPRLEIIQTQTGSHLEDNPQALALATFVYETVFQKWWTDKQLPQRMAAAAEVFPKPRYPTPVLEGQARLNPAGDSWCLVYGMKIDIAELEEA